MDNKTNSNLQIIQTHLNILRGLADIAFRYRFKGIIATMEQAKLKIANGSNHPNLHFLADYSIFYIHGLNRAPDSSRSFEDTLPRYVDSFKNLSIPEKTLVDMFVPLSLEYQRWYSQNKEEIEELGIKEPYELINVLFVQTLSQVAIYFPESVERVSQIGTSSLDKSISANKEYNYLDIVLRKEKENILGFAKKSLFSIEA